jgi:hypothetical protein
MPELREKPLLHRQAFGQRRLARRGRSSRGGARGQAQRIRWRGTNDSQRTGRCPVRHARRRGHRTRTKRAQRELASEAENAGGRQVVELPAREVQDALTDSTGWDQSPRFPQSRIGVMDSANTSPLASMLRSNVAPAASDGRLKLARQLVSRIESSVMSRSPVSEATTTSSKSTRE